MSAATQPHDGRSREALAIRRDRLAEVLLASLNGPMSPEAEDRWLAREVEYRALADEIARRGEPVQQGRLAISAGVR